MMMDRVLNVPGSGAGLLRDWVTVIVPTFDRRDCCNRLVESIGEHYPGIDVLVGDQGERRAYTDSRASVTWYEMPYDVGLSATRNALIAYVQTPYFLLCDDDFVFKYRTDLERMLRIICNSDLDILAGEIEYWDGGATYRISRDGRVIIHDTRPYFRTEEYEICDMVPNFFMGKRDSVLNAGGWRADLKCGEHFEFFYRMKGRLKIGKTHRVSVVHAGGTNNPYAKRRKRQKMYWERVKRGLGIDEAVVLPAAETEAQLLDDTERTIWMYWENPEPPHYPPPHIELCIESIERHKPDGWKVRVLNPDTLQDYVTVPQKMLSKIERVGQKTDYLRSHLLIEHGGMWLDADVIILRSLDFMDRLIARHGLVCSDNVFGRKQTWFLGARKDHALINKWLDLQEARLCSGEKLNWTDLGSKILSEFTYDHDECVMPARTVGGHMAWKSAHLIFDSFINEPFTHGDTVAFTIFNRETGPRLRDMSRSELLEKNMLISELYRHALDCCA